MRASVLGSFSSVGCGASTTKQCGFTWRSRNSLLSARTLAQRRHVDGGYGDVGADPALRRPRPRRLGGAPLRHGGGEPDRPAQGPTDGRGARRIGRSAAAAPGAEYLEQQARDLVQLFPLMLSLSKHCLSFAGKKKGQPFDKLRVSGSGQSPDGGGPWSWAPRSHALPRSPCARPHWPPCSGGS